MRASAFMPWTCIPPLWAKALRPTYGAQESGCRLAVSATKLLKAVSSSSRSGSSTSNPILSVSVGMMEMRLALPQRSP